MNRKTVVTGGAGFVGKALVAELRAAGEDVCSFDLKEPSHGNDIQGSITDKDALRHAFDRAETVFHLAGNAQLWSPDNLIFDELNRCGTQLAAEAATAAGVRRFIHCSSLTTLVGLSTPIGASTADESIQLPADEMLGPYPRSKREAEIIIDDAVGAGLDAVTVLPTEPLGPGDFALTPPTKMILDFANGVTPAYIDCILNFTPVESLAKGLIAAREHGRIGERYLLGGKNTALCDLLEMIERHSGRAAQKRKMPYWVALAAGMVDTHLVARVTGRPPTAPLTGVRLAGRQVSFSSEKAFKELGWRASELEPALTSMLAWAHAQGLLKEV